VASIESIWRRYDADEARLTAGLSQRMIELAQLEPGMHVLDVATGRGEPAILAAHRVGPSGSVVGIDSAKAMLAMAAERSAREGVTNLRLEVLRAEDLATLGAPPFDAALARWGLMYLDDPVAALSAVRGALKAGARLTLAVWAEPERVSYFTLPRRALAPHRALPEDTSNTFRYADVAALERDLGAAGLRIDHLEERWVPVMEAATDADLIAWVRAFGLARLVDPLPEAAQRAWERDVCDAAAPLREGGVVRLGGVTRIVVAR
jgi:SAM-dependent methyltransferase